MRQSEILVELPVPPSGIQGYAENVPYPNAQFLAKEGFPDHVVRGYMAQLYLCRRAIVVHSLVRDPSKGNETDQPDSNLLAIEEIQNIEETKDGWMPPCYQWEDGNTPASDGLSTHLRAKYSGLQVMRYQLRLQTQLERKMVTPNVCQAHHCDASEAIEALVKCTQVFHGIEDSQRIILPNMSVTAHKYVVSICYLPYFLVIMY